MIIGKYPSLRLRRSRKESWSRRLIQENTLSPNDFILPIFLTEGSNKKQEISSMPGVYRYTINRLSQIVDKALKIGIPMIALFPKTKSNLKNDFPFKTKAGELIHDVRSLNVARNQNSNYTTDNKNEENSNPTTPGSKTPDAALTVDKRVNSVTFKKQLREMLERKSSVKMPSIMTNSSNETKHEIHRRKSSFDSPGSGKPPTTPTSSATPPTRRRRASTPSLTAWAPPRSSSRWTP